jgi:hypothetical protein
MITLIFRIYQVIKRVTSLTNSERSNLLYPPSQKAANFSWRMNAERVSTEAVLAMRQIAAFIANMISVGGCASAGFAEAGALVPPTSVDGAPLKGAGD